MCNFPLIKIKKERMIEVEYLTETVNKGDIFFVNLGTERNGHVQNGGGTGKRPCIIVANSKACQVSPTLIVVPITSSPIKIAKELPTHMKLGSLLEVPSIATFEQILTVNRYQLKDKIATLTPDMMITAHQKLQISLGMTVN